MKTLLNELKREIFREYLYTKYVTVIKNGEAYRVPKDVYKVMDNKEILNRLFLGFIGAVGMWLFLVLIIGLAPSNF